ncbi:hypothetical protein CVT24_009280 [Panaeolus cyanescens]|uniref:Uncharacterized protein n=1 Tax=Panaeolus cyanescens TaxID=181874 RepID=A0A409Y8B3_9AGAR|nr:hypothetical protein CVT24_009280 [Panaeolus cyanescens]
MLPQRFTFILFSWALMVTPIVETAPISTSLNRRIDQTISAATKPWQDACVAAGATIDQCSNVAVKAFTSLLEAGGPCDQQDGADAMIDLAKQLNGNAEMIRLAQIFAQQPRNSPSKAQVPYCQKAPKNEELNGLFHCQFAGSDFSQFSGDQTGNIPLGLSAPVSPAGSCPANPSGPVPDGEQLNTLVQSPIAASDDTGPSSSLPDAVPDSSEGEANPDSAKPGAAPITCGAPSVSAQ